MVKIEKYTKGNTMKDYMVQLKGNSTHMDRAHAISWLKASSIINPNWHVQEGKPANNNF